MGQKFVPVAESVTQDGFGIGASSRLVYVRKGKGQGAVNYVVMVLRKMFFEGLFERRETGAFSGAVGAEDMGVRVVSLALCG
ncbi:MAG: hypothetical protein ACYSR5_11180, partial [Planctomycetota bacterium]